MLEVVAAIQKQDLLELVVLAVGEMALLGQILVRLERLILVVVEEEVETLLLSVVLVVQAS
jgi:hypothetical protein